MKKLILAAAAGVFFAAGGTHAVTSAVTSAGQVRGAPTAIAYARQQLGKPYLWGGTGPDSYDCSGLVMMAYRAAGISIARTSQNQWASEEHVSSPEPGDLVFYIGADGTATAPGHVALYIGGGQMIEAYGRGYPIREVPIRPGIVGYTDPAPSGTAA